MKTRYFVYKYPNGVVTDQTFAHFFGFKEDGSRGYFAFYGKSETYTAAPGAFREIVEGIRNQTHVGANYSEVNRCVLRKLIGGPVPAPEDWHEKA